MANKKEIRSAKKQKPQEDKYLPCLHQRMAARFISNSKSEKEKKELLKLASS